MNPREREARGKAAVAAVTACYVDLDLTDGESQESALAAVTDGDAPLPSFVVNSGYGLHEEEILQHYRLSRLEELSALTAARILERLIRLDHDARQVRRPHSPQAGA
jgi:hypothetical protein